MNTIRVVRGVGTAPTEMASYDAALAAANIHNYNLVAVSSVVPGDATVEEVEVAPDLGPAGNRLTVVQARQTTSTPGETAVAGLGWATGSGPGLFYEATGTNESAVRKAVVDGLDAGKGLRDWSFDDEQVALTTAEHEDDGYTTAITVAAYGQSESIF
ncbi:pyruvoyl-dependent arginine decarboxylase subunit alpha [Haloferax mediterranei ATCC 33500]|uniref:arginine decarboxylase n=1 Tax=Haloferax mediterranei (strain ATCC 33500 / DSM 1411 / JCM 8866 / NBRC 14739 / NCIMB 2177 / R-4) TaxID=523841 RepID=I3R684_HALMT|nr:pyruvoyl-dependent arginine decarboxylase [Haloferax mediterranei]AFK19744.1 pyruvoyl-dependent arginine decarboxylase [Haloferax mediterranei ATCC 33500]AHZ23130.1 pyruvoyl-dependent arginine decarboxylase subunit alpha [Haloferax mediterranei ATCC 33500]EMA00065.1 pyruvoyl-dependent arginine decarboxylase [Haloferax mediterranei ATCC 33500]MDX5987512.1 pyruvoyl-dependent arginine decarboxylase [Haloferax mediterranei ATCC 33500]QCQ74010.1 pyruvoyl-dependent arginine decarboxylase subunit 